MCLCVRTELTWQHCSAALYTYVNLYICIYTFSAVLYMHIENLDISLYIICTHAHVHVHTSTHPTHMRMTLCMSNRYGVATIGRLLKITGLFYRISSLL